MNLVERARSLLARFQRKPGWPDPPKDDTHANYRRQYETLLPTLKHLPRGDSYEERQAYLFLAEILIGLHNYGDDPIMPPGVKRIVERVTAEELPALEPRATPARFLGPVAAHPIVTLLLSPWTWLVLSLGLLGLQTGRIGNLQDDARDLRADLAMSERNAADLANTNQRLTDEVNNANRDASASAANWQRERDIRVRAQQEARRIRDAVAQARNGGPVDYGFGGVRDDGSPSAGAPSGDATGRDPG